MMNKIISYIIIMHLNPPAWCSKQTNVGLNWIFYAFSYSVSLLNFTIILNMAGF